MAKSTQNKDTDVTDVTLSDKKRKFIKSFKNSSCNIAETCRKINISRQTYYRWLKDEEFKQECLDAEESLIDNAEDQLQKLINNRNPVAILFYLKTKGKKRGYDEKQTIELTKPFDRIELEGI